MNELPTCGNSPSQPLPIANPPPTSTNGTPVWLGGNPVVMPALLVEVMVPFPTAAAISALTAEESDVPPKHSSVATAEVHEACTEPVDWGCWNVSWPSRM